MALAIKPHTNTLERQWATPFSTECHYGGQEPEVVITKQSSFSDNNIIPNLKIGSIS